MLLAGDMILLAFVLTTYLYTADLSAANEIVESMNFTDDAGDYMLLDYGIGVSHNEI